ncbi:hypothetical protein BHM03_00004399 [Ensete ventricosum]|nr:hypothetical protein BHM03_00004399 [Ensete ventricosum]
MEDGSPRFSGGHHRFGLGGGGGAGRGGGGGGPVAAPFVLKTYRMVDDPSTNAVIAWGRDNNSFVVVDPFAFSQLLLPSHFKHGNFSSFVRQLNTYVRERGFRKVDPDRWEFAHASFLRGQTNLLRLIVRRNSGGGGKKNERGEEEEGEEEEEERVAAEVVRLKQEQRRIDERVEEMWRRVKETERKPSQMLAFLVKVAGDPKLLSRLGAGPAPGGIEGGEKRARLRSGDEYERVQETEGGGVGRWQFDGESMAARDGEEGMMLCGGDGANQFPGTSDPIGFYGGGPAWVGGEFGGMEGDGLGLGLGGGSTAYPFPSHMGYES